MTNKQYRRYKNYPIFGGMDEPWDDAAEFKARWFRKGIAKAESGSCTFAPFLKDEDTLSPKPKTRHDGARYEDPMHQAHHERDIKRIQTLCSLPAGGRVTELENALMLAIIEENKEYEIWVREELEACRAS